MKGGENISANRQALCSEPGNLLHRREARPEGFSAEPEGGLWSIPGRRGVGVGQGSQLERPSPAPGPGAVRVQGHGQELDPRDWMIS